jgi:hypothetical protein
VPPYNPDKPKAFLYVPKKENREEGRKKEKKRKEPHTASVGTNEGGQGTPIYVPAYLYCV